LREGPFKEKQKRKEITLTERVGDASWGAKKILLRDYPFKEKQEKGGTLTQRVGDASWGTRKL
jgi:hypothetical protein